MQNAPTNDFKGMMFFFGEENPLSNWHPAQFIVKGITFCNVEQFMMYCKAMLFKDPYAARAILQTTHPREHKSLGRRVVGFDDQTWILHRENFVEIGCFAKFSQNEDLKIYILSTVGYELVEASPYDRIWGVGLAQYDKRIFDRNNWAGLNLLGKVLMKVRTRLEKP